MPVRNDRISTDRSVFNRVTTTSNSAAGATNVTVSSTTLAPDGMTRNTVVRVEDERARPVDAPRRTRAELIAAGRKNGVPQRVQIGPTCGLYALGMVLDFWNEKDPRNPTAIVQDQDLRGRGKQYTREPTTHERILDVAQKKGFTSQGEMFTARQLALTAKHFGYDATTHEHATLERLYKVLDAGHPAIVAFDVDYNGNPADYRGERAHYAVIEGYVDEGGERYLIARHGWGVQTDHLWKASDFDRSWKALQSTTYYGTPGDGVIPKYPGLREPRHMRLPDVGQGKAGIFEALGCKIVEVVPKGEKPVGGTRA
jgi:hypothetical protein